MRVEGTLLDVGFEDADAVLWVRDTSRGRVRLREPYHPKLYAEPRDATARELKDLLEEHPDVRDITVERRASGIERASEVEVAMIRTRSVAAFREVVRLVERLPIVRRAYDSDLTHELKYLSERGLTPLAGVEAEAGDDGMIREISPVPPALDPEPPGLQLLVFESELDGGGRITTMDHALRRQYTFEGGSAVRDFAEYYVDLDPDVVVAQRYQLAEVIREAARIGVYLGDGGVELTLRDGRSHVDPHTYTRLGLAGLVERTQFTRSPARMCAGWAAGKCIDARQCYDARRAGILVPRAADYQPVMTLQEANDVDKGGLIFAPTVGLHEDVAVLDFESMFPNIIVRRNVSYETAQRPHASGEGFITGFTREALARRLHYKRLRRSLTRGSDAWLWSEERQTALKEMLVVVYGYSGCFANRFGSMGTYMEINRQARDALVESMNLALDRGYATLYGNNDSLFLKRLGATREDYERLAAEITRATGLPMTVESIYRYIVFLPRKGETTLGAVNRYYGVTMEGEYNSRGIELRRHDTPPYISAAQQKAIEALLSCPTAAEVRTIGLAHAREVVEEACQKVMEGDVPEEELTVSRILRADPAEYASRPGHVVAAEALAMNHRPPDVGALIDYLYVDSGNPNPFRRVKPAGYSGRMDAGKYVGLLRQAAETVLAI